MTDLWIVDELYIPDTELEWRYSTSGGPGGQHANRSRTKVEVVFSVESSASLDDEQRAALLAKLGPVVTVSVADSRSQWRNRQLAMRRLATRLRHGLAKKADRRATVPTKSSKQRNRRAKQARSTTKRLRRRPDIE